MKTARVGVLAVQGDFEAHGRMAATRGHEVRPVKAPEHLEGLDALLLPGGESTTMLKLLQAEDMLPALRAFGRTGRPVLGTCAGAILLARQVTGPSQPSLGLLDIDVERNAYGRQIDSFIARLEDGDPGFTGLEGVFIRAPAIRRTGPDVEVLLRHGDQPVLVRQGAVWAATFHPEMTSDPRLLDRVLAS